MPQNNEQQKIRTENLPAIFCPKCNPHTAHEQIYPAWVRVQPCKIKCEHYGHKWHSLTDLDPVCRTPEFRNLKLHIGSILMAEIEVKNGAIEANPATHSIALYVYSLLKQRRSTHESSK